MACPSLHTYGSECRLAPISDAQEAATQDAIPPIQAQFFYSSLVPIDDPFSAATLASAGESKAPRVVRPFSREDNNALERAWLAFGVEGDRETHSRACRDRSASPSLARQSAEKLASLVQDLARKHYEKHAHAGFPPPEVEPVAPGSLADTDIPVCCAELPIDASNGLRETFCAVARKRYRLLDQRTVLQAVLAAMRTMPPASACTSAELPKGPPGEAPLPSETTSFVLPALSTSTRGQSSSRGGRDDNLHIRDPRKSSDVAPHASFSPPASCALEDNISSTLTLPREGTGASIPVRPPAVDDGLSGKPFVRAGGPSSEEKCQSPRYSDIHSAGTSTAAGGEVVGEEVAISIGERLYRRQANVSEEAGWPNINKERLCEIPVGVSRLHMVSLPALQMKPIYWSPVNDVAIVLRATWFYRDTMMPLDPSVANQLEAGYRELRPFTETWSDELRCAVEVGPLGEEKVSYRLWPKEGQKSSGAHGGQLVEPLISSDPFCAAKCFHGEAAAEGTLSPPDSGQGTVSHAFAAVRSYANHHVIYQDSRTAFLLKPSLRPSAYYGRRPVAKISRGLTVGVPVVRGFDADAWAQAHEKKAATTSLKSATSAPPQQVNTAQHSPPGRGCPGCEAEKQRGQVTDLILVAHGIGQKFAERVESFHFTHAITAFRRAVNIEIENESVKPILRDGQNGIMVLPLNWRHTVSFEDGGPMAEDRMGSRPAGFGLKDIEPDTIPAVRSIISDVMFDIPFYMSHHKPKMIRALVGEANRVYRLWCRNNPGFADKGRVHLIAHSLGSVMAIDILSRQPARVAPLNVSQAAAATEHFEFDTTNLFLMGSPAGFFLLLERGTLTPRKGRMKPGAEPGDTTARDIVGDAGVFGCLAVDNIYNILAKEDPIAYLLNGTIDPVYAASLKTAYVPSAATPWLKSIGHAMRSLVPGIPPPASTAMPPLVKPPPALRLPSQLELEVHDFTREEIAEKKALLLNDNGQIDFFLRSGGGPLDVQYLNMLSAHTSYWTNQDLVRLLCVEVGREPGKNNTLPGMRATKVTRRIAGPLAR